MQPQLQVKPPTGNANTIVSGVTAFVVPFVLPFLYQATFLQPTGGFADWLGHHAYLAAAVPFVQQFARDSLNRMFPNVLPKAVSASVTPSAVK